MNSKVSRSISCRESRTEDGDLICEYYANYRGTDLYWQVCLWLEQDEDGLWSVGDGGDWMDTPSADYAAKLESYIDAALNFLEPQPGLIVSDDDLDEVRNEIAAARKTVV